MDRQLIIDKTLAAISKLPDSKVEEIFEFAEFVIKKYEDQILAEEVKKIAMEGKTFTFLESEEELYSLEDLKEVYHAKR